MQTITPLGPLVATFDLFGLVVFAVSGALTAARHRMDMIGVVLIGVITGIGGGTVRDLLIGRTVWWTDDPFELLVCIGAAVATFFLSGRALAQKRALVWSDALGLSAFCVSGTHVAMALGAPFVVSVLMGMLTATGGGIIRDVLTRTQPMILSGELYATAALAGALVYAGLDLLSLPPSMAQLAGFVVAFALRGAAITFGIRMGPPGELIRASRE